MILRNKTSKKFKNIITLFFACSLFLQAEDLKTNVLSTTQQKTRFSLVLGDGVDYIARGEYYKEVDYIK